MLGPLLIAYKIFRYYSIYLRNYRYIRYIGTIYIHTYFQHHIYYIPPQKNVNGIVISPLCIMDYKLVVQIFIIVCIIHCTMYIVTIQSNLYIIRSISMYIVV